MLVGFTAIIAGITAWLWFRGYNLSVTGAQYDGMLEGILAFILSMATLAMVGGAVVQAVWNAREWRRGPRYVAFATIAAVAYLIVYLLVFLVTTG